MLVFWVTVSKCGINLDLSYVNIEHFGFKDLISRVKEMCNDVHLEHGQEYTVGVVLLGWNGKRKIRIQWNKMMCLSLWCVKRDWYSFWSRKSWTIR